MLVAELRWLYHFSLLTFSDIIDMLLKILSYFTKDTCKYKMNRLNQLLSLGFLSFIVVIVGCTIDFTLHDAGMDSGADSGSDSGSTTCKGSNESAYQNQCYRSVATQVTFDAAESSCVVWGGHLASISSDQERNYLLFLSSGDLWIGLHFVGDSFVFTDGSPLIYENWGGGQPRGENCVQMTISKGEWEDKPCSDEYGFVCKRSL
jgi:hypothetical protein